MVRLDHLPSALHSAVRDEEKNGPVLWAGSPSAWATLRGSTYAVLFGAFYAAFAVFWITMASKAPMPFPLFGIPFVLIGCGVVLWPFKTALEARSTVHMVSPRGVVTVTETLLGTRKTDVVLLGQIRGTSRTDGLSGHGTLMLDTGSNFNSRGNVTQSKSTLFGVPNVGQAEAAIVELQSAALKSVRA